MSRYPQRVERHRRDKKRARHLSRTGCIEDSASYQFTLVYNKALAKPEVSAREIRELSITVEGRFGKEISELLSLCEGRGFRRPTIFVSRH